MSKKKFSDGLDDLLNDHYSEQILIESRHASDVGPGAARIERKTHSKNFISDLDTLLQDALDESREKQESRQSDVNTAGKSKASNTAYRAPLTGLDALIRQTIDVREITTDEATGKKRVTVAVEKQKLEKLKSIARMENAFMKDILVQLIDEYIQVYQKNKGL